MFNGVCFQTNKLGACFLGNIEGGHVMKSEKGVLTERNRATGSALERKISARSRGMEGEARGLALDAGVGFGEVELLRVVNESGSSDVFGRVFENAKRADRGRRERTHQAGTVAILLLLRKRAGGKGLCLLRPCR